MEPVMPMAKIGVRVMGVEADLEFCCGASGL